MLALEDAKIVVRWIEHILFAVLGCDWDYSIHMLLEPLRDAKGPS